MKKTFVLLSLLASCGIFSCTVHAADTARKALRAYSKLLNSTEALEGVVFDDEDIYAGSFAIEDINDDGIAELCAFEGEDGKYSKCVFTYYDGEVHKLLDGSKYVSFFGIPENQLFITAWSRYDRGEKDDIYLFDGETLDKVLARRYDKRDDTEEYWIYDEGEEDDISEGLFDDLYDDLKGDEEPAELFTDIHKNTGKIRKNILGYSGGPKKTESEEDDGRYELMNYGFRLVDTDGRGALVFQSSPDGSFMNRYQFSDGEPIYVNLNWREDGYGIAYEDGVYGYVDAGYINWDVEPVSEIDDRFDLTSYEYRRVKTDNSKGALVFQSSPNGSFMNRYQFWNGDRIFVHPYWRQDGYAIAYQDGVYGYVDEDYINW